MKAGVAAISFSAGSLRRRLIIWLLLPLLLLVALNTWSIYRNALTAADLAYDRSLLATARALAERISVVEGKLSVDVPYLALDSFETDTLGRLYYKVTGVNGEYIAGYEDLPGLPPRLPRSKIYPALVHFFDADYHAQALRIAALHQPVYDDQMRGIALVQVAETIDARRGMSRQILIDTLSRQAILVLAVLLLVLAALHYTLKPLQQLSRDVAARSSDNLSDLDVKLAPQEVGPLVQAMNTYIARLNTLIQGQRRFIADASHQLRTPLTILKTQTELALRNPAASAWYSALEANEKTTDHAINLANRLLTLARAEQATQEMQLLDLKLIAAEVCLEFASQAVRREIDLSLDAEGEFLVRGHALLLHEMLSNLLDNALRYTPLGGRVELGLQLHAQSPQGVVLYLRDTGPGIPDSERHLVFQAFYRGQQQAHQSGSGLGLAIVAEILALHEASIHLHKANDAAVLPALALAPSLADTGLLVLIRFSASPTLTHTTQL